MRHEDVLELIKRDEAWELFSVPLYVGLWLNLLLLLWFPSFGNDTDFKIFSEWDCRFLHEIADAHVEVFLTVLLLNGVLGLLLPVVFLVLEVRAFKASDFFLFRVLSCIMSLFHLLWVSASCVYSAVNRNRIIRFSFFVLFIYIRSPSRYQRFILIDDPLLFLLHIDRI